MYKKLYLKIVYLNIINFDAVNMYYRCLIDLFYFVLTSYFYTTSAQFKKQNVQTLNFSSDLNKNSEFKLAK